MLDVILQILSVIGIILLVIIGLILLILICLLFVPVRYEIKAHKYETILAKVKVHWLFHIISASVIYDGEINKQVRVLGFIIYDDLKPKEKKPKKKKKCSKTSIKKMEEKSAVAMEYDFDKPQSFTSDEVPNREQKTDKKLTIIDKIKLKINQFKEKIIAVKEKICSIKNNITHYLEILNEDDTKAVLLHLKKRIIIILKKLAPKKIKGSLHLGTGEPDTTGYLLAIINIVFSYINNDINLKIDFENQIYEGDLYVKGNIQIITLIIQTIAIIKDKKLKPVINKFK